MASYHSPGDAAELAADRKVDKYSILSSTLIFQPLAFEALGAVNSSGAAFFRELGRRLSSSSNDRRATEFLFQRLSVTLQRFNAVAFRGSFPCTPDLD